MTVATSITDFRTDNACDTVQLTDATALRYYNDIRDTVIARITEEKEDYFYNELTVDLVNGQREYSLPKRWDLAEDGVTVLDGIKKIKWVSVKFLSTDTVYSKINPEVIENLDYDPLAYDETRSAFFTLSDNSIFLYPTPTESINAGMVVYAIMEPKRLVSTDTDTLPDSVVKTILLGMEWRWEKSQNNPEMANIAKAEFDRELSRIATTLSGRIQSPKQIEMPYVGNYA